MSIDVNLAFLTSAQAAEELGVTQHQVAMLVSRGGLSGTKAAGRLLVDPYSLRQYKALNQGKGRPMTPAVAWGALWALSGMEAPWLTYQQRRRLAEKLRTMDAATLVWQTRKRSQLQLFRADPVTLIQIRSHLLLSGKSTDRPDIFGMPVNDVEVEGYAEAGRVQELASEYQLQPDISGNLLMHIYEEAPWQEEGRRQMPVAVVAADLAASLNPRESRAGFAALDILLTTMR